MSPVENPGRIRPRILWPSALALALLLLACSLAFYRHARTDLVRQAQDKALHVSKLLAGDLDKNARLMGSLLNFLAEDPCLRESFEARERDRLLACAAPRFEALGARHGITHLYFHDTQGVNWLRVHSPALHGDRIDRATLRQTMETGAPAHGIEIGPLGAFTLRVTAPWRIGGRLVGYLEIGEEVDRLVPRIKDLLGVDLMVLVPKSLLNRDSWTQDRTARGEDADWGRLPDRVVTRATLDLTAGPIAAALAELPRKGEDAKELNLGGRRFYGQLLPLDNPRGEEVGQVLVLDDITAALNRVYEHLAVLAALAIGFGTLLLSGYWAYLGRIQGTLSRLYDDLQATIDRQRAKEARLLAEERVLSEASARREQSMAEEQVLGTLLRLALNESETLSYLESSLDTLLGSVSWLPLQPRAGFLTAKEENGNATLNLAAARNLSTHQIDACAAIPFGTCLCGTAAANRTIVHSDGVDPRHTRCLSEDRDHGHYVVPIQNGDRVLGVLVLYLTPGHKTAERGLRFLGRVADVLSVGISRRQAAEELRIARDDAESASRAKSEFLASMSHEIRTPMNGVLGMADLLADMPLEQEQRELVETIKKSGLALLTVINDILDFSKIEAGRLELEPISFDLGNAAHEVTLLLAARAEQKGLELILHYHADCPRYLVGDPGRIRQILLNLAGNAVKFTERGHVLIDIRWLADAGGPARIHVRVEDTGIGIEPEVVSRLFESFVQADTSTTRRFGGTGLGLAICRRLVQIMGGEIGVESRPGAGSCFWFTLPLPMAEPPPAPPPSMDLSGLHALIVEDNPINQRVYQEQLRSFGMRTEVVGEPRQALDRIRAAAAAGDPFRIGLLDYMMPGMDGEQVARQILADPAFASLPLVLLTSSGQRGDSERLQRAGFSAYLVKPVLIDTLRQCLARILVRDAESSDRAGPRRLETSHSVSESVGAADAAAVAPRYAGRVLLAEDNLINRKVALGMLRKLGIEADTAEDGRETVERCRLSRYDLVLMDCQMPVLDGFDATRSIRDLGGDHRPTIVALTANAMESDRERCLAAGMDDYISKPFRQKDLAAAFERWLPKLG